MLQPGDAEAAYRLGNALLQQGKAKEARAELTRSDKLLPDMPETLYSLGKAAAMDGDAAAAEKDWKKLLELEKKVRCQHKPISDWLASTASKERRSKPRMKWRSTTSSKAQPLRPRGHKNRPEVWAMVYCRTLETSTSSLSAVRRAEKVQ